MTGGSSPSPWALSFHEGRAEPHSHFTPPTCLVEGWMEEQIWGQLPRDQRARPLWGGTAQTLFHTRWHLRGNSCSYPQTFSTLPLNSGWPGYPPPMHPLGMSFLLRRPLDHPPSSHCSDLPHHPSILLPCWICGMGPLLSTATGPVNIY